VWIRTVAASDAGSHVGKFRQGRLEPLLAELPHQRASFVDPGDTAAVGQLLTELRIELERRLHHGQGESPDLLFVVDEWAELADQGPVLDLIARHGPAAGLFTLAATTQVEDTNVESWVALFGTRLVLHTPDEASNVRLLGEAGAEDLDSVGQPWPLVDGRVLHRVRGFRVPPVHLADLVEQMRKRADAEHPRVVPDLQHIFDFLTEDDQDDTGVEQQGPPSPPSPAPAPSSDAEPQGTSRASAASEASESPATTSGDPSPPNGAASATAQQLPLIRAVPLSQRPAAAAADIAAHADRHVDDVSTTEPLVELYLLGIPPVWYAATSWVHNTRPDSAHTTAVGTCSWPSSRCRRRGLDGHDRHPTLARRRH
jgi:hypothetical protein